MLGRLRTMFTPPRRLGWATFSQSWGSYSDGFEDAWASAVLKDRDAVRHFPQRIDLARPPMELRYSRDVADDEGLDWEYATRTIADRQIDDFLRTAW